MSRIDKYIGNAIKKGADRQIQKDYKDYVSSVESFSNTVAVDNYDADKLITYVQNQQEKARRLLRYLDKHGDEFSNPTSVIDTINQVYSFYDSDDVNNTLYEKKYRGTSVTDIDSIISKYSGKNTLLPSEKKEFEYLSTNRDTFMSLDELQAEIKLLEGKSKQLQDDKVSTALDSLGNFFSDLFSSGETAVGETSFVEKNEKTKQASAADTENAARLDKLKKLYASHGDVSSEQLDALYKKANEKNIFSVLSPDYTYADYANDKADKNIYGSAYIQRKDQENLEIIQNHQDEFNSDVSTIETIIFNKTAASDMASSSLGGNLANVLNSDKRRRQIINTSPEIQAIIKKWSDKGYDFEALFETYERKSNAEYTESILKQNPEFAKEHPVFANIESVGTNLIGGIAALPEALDFGIKDLFTDDIVTMDTNSPAWALKNVTDSIRDTTTELLNTGEYGNFKAFLYQTGMSIADFSTTAVATGFAQPATLLVMGSNAAVDTMKTVTERGGSASDALTMGVLAGVFEAVMEKVPLDTIFKSVNTATGQAWIRNIFNGMLTEGFEELGTDLANNLVDVMLNVDQSEFKQNVFNYMQNGMSASEASAKVFAETAANMGLSFLGGAISGGGMTTVGGGIGLARANSEYTNIGENVMTHEGSVDTVMEFAKELVAHDKAVANDVKKVEQKKSARNVGRLYADTQSALSEQNKTTYIAEAKKGIQDRVEALGLDKSTSKAAAEIIYKAYNGENLTARQQKILNDNKYVSRAYRELTASNTDAGRENYTNSWVQAVNENIAKATAPVNEKIRTISAYSDAVSDTVDGVADVVAEDTFVPAEIDTVPAVVNGTEDFTSFVAEARAENMNSGVVKKYNATELNDTAEGQIAVLDAYGKKHGLSFIVVDSIGSEDSSLKANGAYIGKNKIMVSLDSEAGAMLSVAGHEVYHYISKNNKSSADSIKSFVLDKLKNDREYNYSERFEKLAKDYGTEDVDTIEEEMVANAMFDLLSDEKVVNDLAKENPSLLEKIITAIKDFISELKNMAKNLPWKEVAVFQDDIQSLETIRAMAEAALWQINESGKNAADSTNNATKNTATSDGGKYSLGDVKIPTYEELIQKPDIKVIDISTPKTFGTFRERRDQILKNSAEVIRKPYLNKDANTFIFLTKASYTHAFNNLGDIQLNAAEHLPEFIENAVLTHSERNTHGSKYADGIYTFFAAAGFDDVKPVKLKVKEYNYIGQQLPKNIKEYFDGHPQKYASSYDTVVLEVQEVEESLPGSANNKEQEFPFLSPDKLPSKISISDLIGLVNGEAKKYIPKPDDTTKFSFAGGNALTADKSLLAEAMELEKNGVDSEEIRQSTGWFRGYDNKWRFEIDDSWTTLRMIKDIPNYTTLGELILHDKLFKAYPELKDMKVTFQNLERYSGYYNRNFGEINLSRSLKDAVGAEAGGMKQLLRVLSHEVQHAIQHIEGFSRGASLDYWEEALMYDSFAGLTNAQKSKFKQLQKQYHDIEDSHPEFIKEMKKLIFMKPSVKRGAIDFETLTKLEEDPPEWKQFDAERKRLEDKYGVKVVFDFMDLDYNIKKLFESGRSASEMYYDTAGEVEARDVANRLTFDEKDRKNTRPDIDREDVVFADSNLEYSSEETIFDSFGITKYGDYVHVQKQVYNTLASEGFFSDKKGMSRTVINNVSGMLIEINKSGINETFNADNYARHSKALKTAKLATIRFLPEIIEKGKLLNDDVENNHNKNSSVKYAYLEGTISLNGNNVTVKIAIRKSAEKNKFWVHSVDIKNNTESKEASEMIDSNPTLTTFGVKRSISQKVDDVNIKLSLKETADSAATREQLLKENNNLRVANALLKNEMQRTNGNTLSMNQALKLAEEMLSHFGSKYNKYVLRRELYDIFQWYDGEGNTFDYLCDYMTKIGEKVVSQSYYLDKTLYEEYEDARKWIRNMQFTLPDNVLKQLQENYSGKFRQKTMGRMRFVNKAEHPDVMYLSAMYSELADAYPMFFSIEDNEYEQPVKLIEFWEKIQPTYQNPLTELGFKDRQDAAVGFAYETFEKYMEMPHHKTFADKKQQEYKRNLKAAEDKLYKKMEKRLEWQKEYYINAREKSYDGRKKAYVKKKIRNVIKDLDKYLNRGSKDNNVKEGLEETVQTALSTAELLFSEVPTNEDIVRAGVSSYTQREAELLDEYEELLKKREEYRMQYSENNKNQMSSEFLEVREKLNLLMDGIKKRIKYLDKCLEELFEREKRRLEHATVSEALSKLASTYSKIKDSEYSYIAQSYNQNVYDKIDDIIKNKGDAKISLLSTKELDDIYVVYKMVLHTVRNANKVFTSEKKETAEELGKLAMSQIREVGGNKKRRIQALDVIKKFGWSELKPIYAFRLIGSSVLSERYAAMRNGEDTYYRDVAHAKEFYSSLREKYKTDEWKLDKGYEFVSKDGDKFSLSLEQIMSIYAYSRRGEQAVTHLVRGGFVFSDAITVEEKKKGKILKYKVDNGAAYSLTTEILAQINDVLDNNQRAYVEEMQKYLSDVMGNKGNEVSMKMYGVKLFNEKNYFPLKSSAFYRAFDGKVEGEATLKNAGFSKAITPKANNPIVLDDFINVWSNHVQDMAMYHSFVLPIEDFTKVFNYEAHGAEYSKSVSLKATLQGAYGPTAEQYVRALLTDLNSGVRSQSGSEYVNKLTGLAKKGAVFASMSVVIQQPSAVVRATAHINPKYFINALPKSANWLTVSKQYEELKKYAPVAGIKEMGYFDTGFGKSTAEWITEKEYRGFGKKLTGFIKDGNYRDDVFSSLASKADEVSWGYIWNAVKKEVAEKQNLSGEELLQAAGKRFTEVIELTQVYDSVFSKSGLMRSKDTGVKMVTSFMAEPTTQINMIVDAIIQGKRDNKKYTAVAFGAVYASILVNAMLKSIVTAARDDDDEFSYSEKYISNLISSFVSDGSIVSSIPFARDIISLVQGYDVERMDMTVIADVINSFRALQSDKKTTFEKISGIATSLLALVGVPATNILKDMKALYNTYQNIVSDYEYSPGAMHEAIKRELTGKSTPKADLLYNAIVSGDTEYAERLAAKFETESGYNTAVRDGLKKYDTRIYDAAVARMNSDTAEYMRLAKEIIAEKNFSQDNIVAAINSIIRDLSSEKQEETPDKVKSIFTDADYFDAILGGDGKTAEIVGKELVATDVANGKTKEDSEKSLISSLRNNVRDAFEAGEIDSSESKKILVSYCDMTDSEAENKVRFWDFKIDYPDYDLSEETVTKYYTEIKSSGINIETYYEYYVNQKACKGVLGSDGKTVSGSKKNQIMKVIDDLPLTNKQKDVLYFQNGWSESKLYEAPWH